MKIISREFLFEEDRPFASCHASTLVKLPGGDILAAWFGGSREGADDTGIWSARRHDGKWSYPEKIADQEGMPHWNPVLFAPEAGTVHLFYKEGKTIPGWRTMHAISADGGLSWGESGELVPGDRGGRGPVKNKPIVTGEGTWAAPASLEGEYWDACADLSHDHGRTWRLSPPVPFEHSPEYPGKGIIQPSLWESEPGRLHMLLRSTAGRIFRSDSVDNGRSWCAAYPTFLPNNNSGIDCVAAADGTIVLVYNPVGMYKGPRTPLIVSYSNDNGRNWKQGPILEETPGEYSYPAIIADKDALYITYTWRRERIVYVELHL